MVEMVEMQIWELERTADVKIEKFGERNAMMSLTKNEKVNLGMKRMEKETA